MFSENETVIQTKSFDSAKLGKIIVNAVSAKDCTHPDFKPKDHYEIQVKCGEMIVYCEMGDHDSKGLEYINKSFEQYDLSHAEYTVDTANEADAES